MADQTSKAQQICCLLFLLKAGSQSVKLSTCEDDSQPHHLADFFFWSANDRAVSQGPWSWKDLSQGKIGQCNRAVLFGDAWRMNATAIDHVSAGETQAMWSTHAKVKTHTANTVAGVGKCLFFPLNYYYNSDPYMGDVSRYFWIGWTILFCMCRFLSFGRFQYSQETWTLTSRRIGIRWEAQRLVWDVSLHAKVVDLDLV